MIYSDKFVEETPFIYRLKLPFDTVYTSVFLVKSEEGYILVDCATTDLDVDEGIIPALIELGVRLSDVKKLVVTHNHSDHAGGLPRLRYHLPHVEVVSDERELYPSVCTYYLPGHTKDFVGILDLRTNTLISGDGLQGAGVDKYKTSVPFKEEYLKTLERVINNERIENILFSHAYEPWFVDKILGRDKVIAAVCECKKYI